MPIIKSAKKAARQALKRTEHNKEIKKDIKSAVKAFKANPTVQALSKAQSELDKAVKKNLLKKNTAARRKANLHKFAKEAGLKLEAIEKKTTQAVSETVEAVKKSTAKTTVAKKSAPAKKATK